MAAPRNDIIVALGEPKTLLRFVLAATIDASGLRRGEVAAEWASASPTLSSESAASSLSRYFRSPDPNSPTGGPSIPSDVAEAIQQAVAHLSDRASDEHEYWSFRAFRDRLLPEDRGATPGRTGAGRFSAVAQEPPRNDAELFMQAAALLDEVRHAPLRHGWAVLATPHLTPATRLCERLLVVSAGGGPHGQLATTMLGDLTVERTLWHQVAAFVADHPLGGRGVGVFIEVLRRRWSTDPATIDGALVSRTLKQLHGRCEHEPPNEDLRAPRGLMVEALGQIDPKWANEHAPWVRAALLDRSTDDGRTLRDRTFAGLVFAKRFDDAEGREAVQDLYRRYLADPDLDPMARISVERHFALVMANDYGSAEPGEERNAFYDASPFTPWKAASISAEFVDREVTSSYRSVRDVVDAAIEAVRSRDPLSIPKSVLDGTGYLIEAALFDIDAVARRIAIDTLRCAGLAEPAAAVLGAVLGAPALRPRVWVRCTALSALGLLQHHTTDTLDAAAAVALDPPPDGAEELITSAVLCLGDLVSEQNRTTTSQRAADHISALIDRLVDAREARRSIWTGRPDKALAYLLCEARHMHPRSVQLSHQLEHLGATSNDRGLASLVSEARHEILEGYLTDPLRALDPEVIYRTEGIAALTSTDPEQVSFTELVRQVASTEQASFEHSPATYASMAAGNQLALRSQVRSHRGEPDDLAWQERFVALHSAGMRAVTEQYQAVLNAHELTAVIDVTTIARILSMWSEGTASQAGVDPSVLRPLDLSRKQLESLRLEDSDGPWTMFSLVAALLARALTRPAHVDKI